ncbi:MAG TPA: hypothetical protein VKR05_02325 [Candidatus Cybelea sp.]|nr:hypothetical protein [Candidatus Cybelea sp.]
MIAFAMLLALSQAATQLSIQPWTGSDFQTTTTTAAKYRLEVDGKPNATVRLRALDVAHGWLAAFCTPKFCSPQQLDVQLPHSGSAVVQFELIRESLTAPKRSGAKIAVSNGAPISVPAAFRE